MEPVTETMSVDEFYAALDNVSADVLATHLILMEEVRAIREEVYDRDKEVRRFIDLRRDAAQILMLEKRRQSEILRTVLERVRQTQQEPL